MSKSENLPWYIKNNFLNLLILEREAKEERQKEGRETHTHWFVALLSHWLLLA